METASTNEDSLRYNGMSHPLPFMKATTSVAAPKKPKEVPDLEEAVEEDDDADVAEPEPTGGDDELDLKGDKYIKKPKPKAKKPAKKKAAKNDDDEDEQPKARGKKGAAAKGRGKK